MANLLATPPAPAGTDAIQAARPEVKKLLTAIPNFLALPEAERQRIAADTVRVVSYMTDPGGVHAEIAAREASGDLPRSGALAAAPPAAAPAAAALADDPVEATKRQLSQSPGFAGKDFKAGAVEQGVEQFGKMVQKVDFSKFV